MIIYFYSVVIYDSDWNPQNDVQAQARCHRIGQEKKVKVYRLVSRATYEMMMFQRASKKLGLDQVVLHQVGGVQGSQSPPPEAGAPGRKPSVMGGQLSKEEINTMLKWGAYDLFRDENNAEATFCEQDIEDILERRTSRVTWKEDAQGGMFSKASFQVDEEKSSVDIDAPDFWEKILPQAVTAKVLFEQVTALIGGKSEAEKRAWLETKKPAFLHDLENLVSELVAAYNDAKGKIPSDRESLRSCLMLCRHHTTLFTEKEQQQLLEWEDSIDFSRRKRKTIAKYDKPDNEEAPLEMESKRKKKKHRDHSEGSSPRKHHDKEHKEHKEHKKHKEHKEHKEHKHHEPSISRQPTYDVLTIDWLPLVELQPLYEAFFLYGRPAWKFIQAHAPAFSHYSHRDIYELVVAFLQRCVESAHSSDQEVFIKCLDLVHAGEPHERPGRPKNRKKKPVEIPELLFPKNVDKKLASLAARLTILHKLNLYSPSIVEHMDDFGRKLVPWWDVSRDQQLLLGVHKHGWGCFDAVLSDENFSFVTDIATATATSSFEADTNTEAPTTSIKVMIGSKKISSTKIEPKLKPTDEELGEHVLFLLQSLENTLKVSTLGTTISIPAVVGSTTKNRKRGRPKHWKNIDGDLISPPPIEKSPPRLAYSEDSDPAFSLSGSEAEMLAQNDPDW